MMHKTVKSNNSYKVPIYFYIMSSILHSIQDFLLTITPVLIKHNTWRAALLESKLLNVKDFQIKVSHKRFTPLSFTGQVAMRDTLLSI